MASSTSGRSTGSGSSRDSTSSTDSTGPAVDPAPGLGAPAPAPRGSWRDRTRRKPGIGQAYRIGVFVLGLACIVLGFALVVLPGPLTIPPILLGLYIWSTEFSWAHRMFETFKEKGREAWAHAKVHPVSSSVITVGGLIAAGVAIWAVGHYDVVAKGRDAVGL